ncbi:hypothetical protein FRC11_010452 [Ceratobasidium sp. 423]|nr:hypothetical protein FRC11_010452 [Ceratobasidium sp. 423]
MTTNNRKRTRTNNQSSNNSFATLVSNSSEEGTVITPSTQIGPTTDDEFLDQAWSHISHIHKFLTAPEFSTLLNGPKETKVVKCVRQLATSLETAVLNCPELNDYKVFTKFPTLRRLFVPHMDEKSSSTEPPPAPPTYNNVGCMAETSPTPSVQPLNPSPSPKPGPRPPQPPRPKKAQPFTPRPRPHQVRSNVRLVACIAGRADAITSETPRWKAVPTDCFSSLSKDLKAAAPGCTPLRFHCNQKGNLIITFTPTASRSLLMSNLNIIRGNFELAFHVPILFDTPRSTLHLTHVPARAQDGSPIFDQSALAESILANPALSTLPLTSPPRWLRHPSKITGIRSSAVLTFEDPDGAIIQQLLKTPLFVFGQPVTVKPWINKPAIVTRQPRDGSARDTAPTGFAMMDI